jgi:hypothetical protein
LQNVERFELSSKSWLSHAWLVGFQTILLSFYRKAAQCLVKVQKGQRAFTLISRGLRGANPVKSKPRAVLIKPSAYALAMRKG